MSADKVHYVNGRGVVQHTFDAEVPEELSVYPGEEVRFVIVPPTRHKVAHCASETEST